MLSYDSVSGLDTIQMQVAKKEQIKHNQQWHMVHSLLIYKFCLLLYILLINIKKLGHYEMFRRRILRELELC